MYRCVIEYLGNNESTDTAQLIDFILNGTTYNNPSPLYDFEPLKNFIFNTMVDAGVTPVICNASTWNSQTIIDNAGANIVFIDIFYPSAELTASVDVLINGVTETFNFEKIATV